ncbi:phosphatase [Wenjunlia vitaminophila]|uniref:Phosphatase n=1 Tax=Wenjunlia vitaminophila TaxID=76728 RepID=A0A0T6LNY1_WENVI|nr:phosphatase [Wenjunlia vitaminophila]KRV47811.1 phosphatase [Wenjunlia vitaminophila]
MSTPPVPAPVPTRTQLIDHLVRTRIAGDVATPRENNRAHYKELVEGNRHYWLGLEFGDRWTDEHAVLSVMAERCGVVADPDYRVGQDTIDPELTVDALDRMAVALRKAAEGRHRVLVATGHPAGLLPVHQAVAVALKAVGCTLYALPSRKLYADEGDIRQVGDVAMIHRQGSLMHTHSPEPMATILAALEEDGEPLPDLVLADHGWAGRAGQCGISTVGFADCNDPALFLGEAEGTLAAVVPLDDNVPPQFYAPMTAYLLDTAGLLHEE